MFTFFFSTSLFMQLLLTHLICYKYDIIRKFGVRYAFQFDKNYAPAYNLSHIHTKQNTLIDTFYWTVIWSADYGAFSHTKHQAHLASLPYPL